MATPSSKEIAEQIEKLSKVLQIAREYGTPDFASEMGMKAMLSEEARLQNLLKSAQMAEKELAVEITVDGDPVNNHAVSISFFGQLMVLTQSLTNAIAQVQSTAKTTIRARIKENLIASNRLELSTTFASSFGAGLRLSRPPQGELEFVDDSATDVLCNLLDGDPLTPDAVEFLSSPRVRGRYAEIVGLIAKQGASVTVRTQSKPQGSKLSAQQARDRIEWLDLLVINNDTITVQGQLTGGSIETKKFEIKPTDDGEVEFYRGSVVDEAIAQMKRLNMGASVEATIDVSTSTHEEAALERVAYRLLKIVSSTTSN